MHNWYPICIVIIIVSGCSTTPVNVLERHDRLEVELSKSTEDQFRLIDRHGAVVSSSDGGNRSIDFYIPNNVNLNECLFVIDKRGNAFLKDGVRLSLIKDFRRLKNKKLSLENREREEIKSENRYKQLINTTDSELNSNRAFNGKSCDLPDTKPIPKEPTTACTYESECREEGAAICYTRHIGIYGCNVALNNIGVSSILTSPFCAERAAALAEEKYNMDGFVVDLLVGVADSAAENYKRSESWEDKAWGWAIQAASAAFKINAAIRLLFLTVNSNPPALLHPIRPPASA